MANHSELVAEMTLLEQMGTQERQKLAKKRRLQQLKKWSQREKEYMAKEKQINKRLANMINEENNGLNLKQYTSYNSNNRTKTKLTTTTASTTTTNTTNGSYNGNTNNNNNLQADNNNYQNSKIKSADCYSNGKSLETAKELAPNGKVHFNVGVMLLEAAARNDYQEVKRLLMLGVSPDSVNHDGLTALHQCCIDASEPMMNLLLEFGANVDARDTEQWTPLHAACTCGHLNLVKVLVENGADLLAVNGDGNMPFDACENEETLAYIESQMVQRGITQEMIDITRASTEMQMICDLESILAEGGELNSVWASRKDNVSFLHVAAANAYLSAVKFLLKNGANVNVCDNDLWTPLHGAACWGNEQHIKIVDLLIESGAKLDAKTINDETVFELCDNPELLERLNQIKDELESKQKAAEATAANDDRTLRRTQSRTNSWAHSVRRTSVRDKNQISKREARQEAMLRVESDTSLDNAIASGAAANGLPPVKSPNSANSSSSSSSARADSSEPASRQALELRQTDLDRLEDEHEPGGAPLVPTSAPEQNSHPGEAAVKSVNAKDTNRKVLVRQNSLEETENVIAEESAESRASNKKVAAGTRTTSLTTVTLLNGACQLDPERGKPLSSSSTSRIPSAAATSNVEGGLDQVDGPADAALKGSQASNVAFIAPVNYTLSNLKKQRSDLRMRNSSIGGSTTTTTTLKTSNGVSLTATPQSGAKELVELDPGAGCFLSEGGSDVAGSGIRKFSGEPSETVGGKKGRHHMCCSLI